MFKSFHGALSPSLMILFCQEFAHLICLGNSIVLFQMEEVNRPADDDFRKVMALTGVDEVTAQKVLEESNGDMTAAINKLLDDLEDDMGAPVVNQVILSTIFTAVSNFCFRTTASLRLR